MKIKTVIYVIMILTGILINKYGLKTNNPLEPFFGGTVIALGSFNIILDYLKGKK